MKKLTKIFVLILSVALVCTALAVVVSANDVSDDAAVVGAERYATFEEAINKAPDGGTIKLVSDINLAGTCEVQKNVTVNLNGHTLTSELSSVFNIEKNISLTISGHGKINLSGNLVTSEADDLTVTVKGTTGKILINHDAMVESSIISTVHGTYTFNNLDVNAVVIGSGEAAFKMMSKDSKAKFNFIGSTVNVTGCETSSTGAEAIMHVQGKGSAYINYCTMTTDGVAIRLNNTSNEGDVLKIENSYIRAFSPSHEIAAIGMYATVYGTITVNKSVIESSYRVISVNSEKVDTEVEVGEDGVIESTGGSRMLCYDSVLFLNASKAAQIVRAIPTFLYGSSYIMTPGDVNIVNFDTESDEYNGTNPYVNVYMAVGTRVSRQDVATNTSEKNGVKFPDGSNPGESTTYGFVYDPVGNPSAPYVVVSLTDKDEGGNVIEHAPTEDKALYTYYWFANGNSFNISNTQRTIVYQADKNISGGSWSGDFAKLSGWWWNKTGLYSLVTIDGNPMFRYESYVNEGKAPVIVFGAPVESNIDTSQTDNYSTIVMEIDITTDSDMGYPKMSFKPMARGTAEGNADYKGDATMTINNDGTLSFPEGTTVLDATVSLSLTSWNRMSMVIDTSTRAVLYYINGTAVALNTNAYKEGAYLFGMRFDVVNNIDPGYSFLADNAKIVAYSSVTEFDNAEKYLSSYPVNSEYVCKDITVGGVGFKDLNTAIEEAAKNNTAASVNADLENQTVTVNGFVASNGYTISTTEESNKAAVYTYSDGSVAGYLFDERYNDYKATYYWFTGDISDPTQWLDESKFVKSECSIGQIPTVPEGISFEPVLDYEVYSVAYHSGWDYDGDGKDAVELGPLSVSQITDGGAIYMYPTYEAELMTFVVLNNESGAVEYYSTSSTLSSTMWEKFTAGTTLKLLSDFTTASGSGVVANTSGGVYNLDFNGHTIFYTRKHGGFIRVSDGATLNVYSSKPGGMFYAVELIENSSDKSTKIGSGTFINFKDNVGETLAAAKGSTYETTLNVGKVTIDEVTYPGSNLTLAGDCLVEPRVGGYNAAINIDGITMARIGTDYGAAILSRYYYGSLNVTNTTFIGAVAGTNFIGNHSKGDTAECVAAFDNCSFLYPANGADGGSLLYRNNGFKSITFTNCVTNGRMNPCTSKGVTVVGENTAAYALDWNSSDYADGIVSANYNVAMDIPTLSASDYSSYFTQDENGVIRIKLWKYSADTSIGAYGGAVSNGYLYIYPNGYEGEAYTEDATLSVTLPVLTHKTTANYVTVTYQGSSEDEVLATEIYAKGGNIKAANVKADDILLNATKLVHDGTWTSELPLTNVQSDMTLTPLGYTAEANIDGMKTSVSLYTDFNVNLYIPAAYKDYITEVKNGDEVLEVKTVNVEGTDYLKATVKMASFEATRDAVFTISITEDEHKTTATATVSVASYAKDVLNSQTSTDEEKMLVRYMAAYANEASKYFNGESDSSLEALTAEVEDYEIGAALDVSSFGSVFKSATVDLGAELACVLVVNDSFVGTLRINGAEYVIGSDSERVITIKGLSVAAFALDLAIVATDSAGNAVLEAAYNYATFVQYHIANAEGSEKSAACLPLAKAFYNYSQCAYQYVNSLGAEG